MKRHCDVESCPDEATWRQYDPVDVARPVFVCTTHWNEIRIFDNERSMRYAPVRFFPEEAAERPS